MAKKETTTAAEPKLAKLPAGLPKRYFDNKWHNTEEDPQGALEAFKRDAEVYKNEIKLLSKYFNDNPPDEGVTK